VFVATFDSPAVAPHNGEVDTSNVRRCDAEFFRECSEASIEKQLQPSARENSMMQRMSLWWDAIVFVVLALLAGIEIMKPSGWKHGMKCMWMKWCFCFLACWSWHVLLWSYHPKFQCSGLYYFRSHFCDC
jgi:hypothetical protein